MTFASQRLLLIPAGLTALGVGLLVLALGQGGVQLYQALTRRRLWGRQDTAKVLTPEALYRIPPLLPWVVLCGGLGWLLGQFLLTGPVRHLGPLAALLPLVWKQQRIREGQQQVRREVGELVEELRLYLAFAATPGAALTLILTQAPPGILWDHLRRQKDTVLIAGAEAALENVAQTLTVPTLNRLVTRVRASRAGATPLTAALRTAADELAQDLRREVEEQVEATPTRLLVPMLVLLMVPLLIVVLTPPVQTLLATLTGVGPTPLGN